MKKMSARYKKWLLRRSIRGLIKRPRRSWARNETHFVNAYIDGEMKRLMCERRAIMPPARICLNQTPGMSIKFLDYWRDVLCSGDLSKPISEREWLMPPKTTDGLNRISTYIDFSKIEYMSTAAALTLVADYDRVSTIMKSAPPLINLTSWRKSLFRKLYEIGFFEVLGLTEKVKELYVTSGNMRSMRIVSGSNTDELRYASDRILELASFIDEQNAMPESIEVALNSSIGEAMANVVDHAYPDDHGFRYQHVGKWWVTASANRKTRNLTIVIYDQGASIPVTFARKPWSESVKDYVLSLIIDEKKFDFQNDGTYISGAMVSGKSQTNQTHRGLGLPEMKELIDICGDGSLAIFSRGGEYRYESGQRSNQNSRRHSIGGTLIEWRLRLPEK